MRSRICVHLTVACPSLPLDTHLSGSKIQPDRWWRSECTDQCAFYQWSELLKAFRVESEHSGIYLGLCDIYVNKVLTGWGHIWRCAENWDHSVCPQNKDGWSLIFHTVKKKQYLFIRKSWGRYFVERCNGEFPRILMGCILLWQYQTSCVLPSIYVTDIRCSNVAKMGETCWRSRLSEWEREVNLDQDSIDYSGEAKLMGNVSWKSADFTNTRSIVILHVRHDSASWEYWLPDRYFKGRRECLQTSLRSELFHLVVSHPV